MDYNDPEWLNVCECGAYHPCRRDNLKSHSLGSYFRDSPNGSMIIDDECLARQAKLLMKNPKYKKEPKKLRKELEQALLRYMNNE